jgi:hypothetical protein
MRSRALVSAALAVFLCAGWSSALCSEENSDAPPARGVIVSASGDVAVHSTGERRRAVEGLPLSPGDTLVARQGASCTGFAPDGEFISLTGPSELRLAPPPPGGIAERVSTWIRTQLTQWIGARHRQPLVTRSLPDRWDEEVSVPQPLIPAPGGSVRATGSELRWTGVAGVNAFTVVVASETDDEIERTVRGRGLTLNDLTGGREYVWKVRASAGKWSAESHWRAFRVLTSEEEANLEAALEGLGDLEAGVLLLSTGLHGEAVARFDAALSAGADVRSVRRWRARALADVGLYKEAYEDLIAASDPE